MIIELSERHVTAVIFLAALKNKLPLNLKLYSLAPAVLFRCWQSPTVLSTAVVENGGPQWEKTCFYSFFLGWIFPCDISSEEKSHLLF